MAMPEIKNSSN